MSAVHDWIGARRRLGGSGGVSIVPAFADSAVDAANKTAYTFSSMSFGAAAAGRKMIVVVSARGVSSNTTISSCTIGGVTATSIVAATVQGGAGVWNGVEMFIADVPAGTTGDVVATYSLGQFRCGCALYQVTGLTSSDAHDTATDLSGDPLTALIDVPAGGFVVAGCFSAGSVATTAWTAVDKQYDEAIEGTDILHSGGFKSYPATQTDLSVEADFSAAPAEAELMAVATWG